MKELSILNQVEEEEVCDKINRKLTHDYLYQKNNLSIVRLKEAGFQLSNSTPGDGNCLIHALKDQMRYYQRFLNPREELGEFVYFTK